VLVVANLGPQRLSSVALSSSASVLPTGRYAARPLLGDRRESSITVRREGRIAGWIPAAALEPFETYLFELSPRR
jgi:hypothetical protein